jgi:hypothetical protein
MTRADLQDGSFSQKDSAQRPMRSSSYTLYVTSRSSFPHLLLVLNKARQARQPRHCQPRTIHRQPQTLLFAAAAAHTLFQMTTSLLQGARIAERRWEWKPCSRHRKRSCEGQVGLPMPFARVHNVKDKLLLETVTGRQDGLQHAWMVDRN